MIWGRELGKLLCIKWSLSSRPHFAKEFFPPGVMMNGWMPKFYLCTPLVWHTERLQHCSAFKSALPFFLCNQSPPSSQKQQQEALAADPRKLSAVSRVAMDDMHLQGAAESRRPFVVLDVCRAREVLDNSSSSPSPPLPPEMSVDSPSGSSIDAGRATKDPNATTTTTDTRRSLIIYSKDSHFSNFLHSSWMHSSWMHFKSIEFSISFRFPLYFD